MAYTPGDKVSVDREPWHTLAPGLSIKLLRCSEETGHFTVMIKAEKGSVLPRHRHLSSAEFYILEGKGHHPQTGDFAEGDYVYEHTGAIHDPVTFDERVVLFMVNHGPTAFLNPDDSVQFIMDVEMLKSMAA